MIPDPLPQIEFSPWIAWQNRSTLRRDDGPWLGMYLWGRFSAPPSSATRPFPHLPEQVIYVGETKDLDTRPLTGRHHRLSHYHDTFPDDKHFNNSTFPCADSTASRTATTRCRQRNCTQSCVFTPNSSRHSSTGSTLEAGAGRQHSTTRRAARPTNRLRCNHNRAA